MIYYSIEKLAIIGVASLAIVAQAAPAAEPSAIVERGFDSLPDYKSQLYARDFDDVWWNRDAESSVKDKRDILDERSPQRQAPGPEPGEGNSPASQPKTGGTYRPGTSRPSNSRPGSGRPGQERGGFNNGRPSDFGSGRGGRGGFGGGRPSDFGGGRGGRGGFGGRPSSDRPDQGRGGFINGRPSDFGSGRGGRGGFGRRPPSNGRRGGFSP